MNKILVYGTLRQGDYNFERIEEAFGKEAINKVGEATVSGYKMHNLGPYPGITKGDDTDKIVCDILEVSDSAFDFIGQMERGAGYIVDEVPVGEEALPIFVYRGSLSQYRVIEHGDWFKA